MGPNISERRRVREVRKYYNRSPNDVPIAGAPLPPGQDGLESTKGLATTPVASPNKTLTALMQLIACRLGMQRAMVSVVDESAQYFLAESTKTLDLVNPLKHAEGDELWMGCGGTIRSEALCANTIKLPYQDEGYACFSVSDLPQDPRFCKLPYVAGPPYFRFYAGTPLLTRDNVPIGSVFVIDTRARGAPTQFEINLLGIMAKNVMEYLEMRRESEMRKRNQIMSQGLAALVDGRFSILPLAGSENLKQPCCVAASETIPEESSSEESSDIDPSARTDAAAGTSVHWSAATFEETTSTTASEDIMTNKGGRTAQISINKVRSNEKSLANHDRKQVSMNRVSVSAEDIFGGRSSYHTNTEEENPTTHPQSICPIDKPPSEEQTTKSKSLKWPPGHATKCKALSNSQNDVPRYKSCCTELLSENQPSARRQSLSEFNFNDSQGSSYLQTKSRTKGEEEIPTYEQIVANATNLLRESLDVDYAVFLNTIEDFTCSSTNEESNLSCTGAEDERPILLPRHDSGICLSLDLEPNELPIRSQRPLMSTVHSSKSSMRQDVSAKVVSFSSRNSCSYVQEEINPEFGFRSPACKELRRLLKRYPEGKLWTFNSEGLESSDEEDTCDGTQNASRATKFSEARFLIQCFPGARQIVWAPLFNVEKSIHVAACFCVCLEPTPIFTAELELAFLRAFMNNVSVTCNRSSMAAANRLKGDFISSISHELRSPLHGILASVELLSNSPLDRPQKEHCSTISICGQSLLDTITGILEYTKINTLQKDTRRSATPKDSRPPLLRHGSSDEGILNRPVSDLLASSNVDISKVCEDSCLLVAAAYMHHTPTPNQPLYRVFVPPGAAYQLNGDVSTASAPVVIILDISPGNWKMVALPGALQRIVMNLVGNSLKYTSSGFIKVKLDLHPTKEGSDSNTGSAVVELNVVDSGRGISNEFLKTKIFSPFSQETILAPGTGLGLHLVKSLVQMHEGNINIESEVGVGTHVTVKLRLQQAPVGCEPESGLQLARNESDDSIAEVRQSEKNKTFLLYGFDSSTNNYIRDSLHLYFTKWFGMTAPLDGEEPAIVIANEDRLASCLSFITVYRRRPQVIVICDQMRQKHLSKTQARAYNSLEILTIPFGPYKLSKALLACLRAELEPEQPLPFLNGFHIPNAEALKFTDGSKLSPVAFIESPYSSGSDSFPWMTPATQMTVHVPNVRELPTPISGANLPASLPISETTFTLSPKSSPEAIPEPTIDSTQPRVLCVDDNSINLRLLKTFMEKLKFKNITCAENGSQAFEAVRCQKQPFDLIFMDLSMPVCDGFQAIALIRTLEKINQDISPPNMPLPKPALIVALTGLASQRDQDTAREAGADHYITKPMKLSLLKSLLPQWGISVEGNEKKG